MISKEALQVRVRGNSMAPLYLEGDILEVDPYAYERIAPQVGDKVLVEHPYRRNHLLVKEIRTVTPDKVFIRGINADESTDSRSFGMLSKNRLKGKIKGKVSGAR